MRPVHILLVEDNEGDVILTLEAFKEGNLHNRITVVRDGDEAIRYLTQSDQFAGAELPDIILLDINLPKVDGKEVLHFIKTDENLKSIPVVILTTSSSERDIRDAYLAHANCYITKPVELDKFLQIMRSIENFWISVVTLAPQKV